MKMVGLPMPRGTWLILVVAIIPVLVSQVASAAPGYPVEEPAGTSYVVAFDPPSHVLTLTSSTTSTPDESGIVDGSDGADGSVTLVDDPGLDSVVSIVAEDPNGQINHGQVVKKLHELADGHDTGCLTSAVAQSDLGKGAQQVEPGEIDALTIDVNCAKTNNSAHSDSGGSGDSQGKSDKAPGRSDKAPGKSDK